MEPFAKIRLWEVRFQIVRPQAAFPVPHEIVLERQTSPRYHLKGCGRPENMTQLVCSLEGEGAFQYGTMVYPLTPGKGFMCRLGDPQSAYYYPGDYVIVVENNVDQLYRITTEGLGDSVVWEYVGPAPEEFKYLWMGEWIGEYLRIPQGSNSFAVTGTSTITIDPQWRWI